MGAHPWVLQDPPQGEAVGGAVAEEAADEILGSFGDGGGEMEINLRGGGVGAQY